ncbi:MULTISPECIES: hypothetical protein [Halorussus]|uniref:hypothetical protein n=1 Tax=Halorussus TaxID=1070314 RepID=UPI00209FC427|nr:hypothetical protein [Halorussus vallis]USZ75313.1 hypothetical protein NGM07_18000 [Halorussus vallis]
MEDGPERDFDWLTRSDVAILRDLSADGPDYIPLVANRIGIHLKHVESRCTVLLERGLIEQTTDEVIYRLTEDGEQCLRARSDDEAT